MLADPAEYFIKPRRQSAIAILLILLKFGRTLLRQGWPLLLIFVLNKKRGVEIFILGSVIIAGILSAIASVVSYFKFYYWIKDDEIIISSGLVQKKLINIPFERIQSINFGQNPVHQLFNVVSLEIDTAGSSTKEAIITALSKQEATAIRDFILAQKAEVQVAEITDIDAASELQETTILHLSVSDLLKTGISQNHLRALGIMLAFGFGLLELLEDTLGEKAYKTLMASYFGTDVHSVLASILFLLPFIIFLTFIFSLANMLLRYYDMRLIKTASGFKTMSGLFNKREQSAPLRKIQLLQWSSNPLKKYFHIVSVQMQQASSALQNRRQAMYIPACYPLQLQAIRLAYSPEDATLSFTNHRISPLIIGRRVLYNGVLPAVVLLILFRGLGYYALFFLLIVPLSWWMTSVYYKKWRYQLSTEGLRIKKGIIGEDAALLRWSKVQAVRLQQSIYQRRKQLANLQFYTAAGHVTIPYIELDKAIRIKNYVLFRVESDEENWM